MFRSCQTGDLARSFTEALNIKQNGLRVSTNHCSQLWATLSENAESIRKTLDEEARRDNLTPDQIAGRRSSITARLFRELSNEERAEWETKAKAEGEREASADSGVSDQVYKYVFACMISARRLMN